MFKDEVCINFTGSKYLAAIIDTAGAICWCNLSTYCDNFI